jgi:ATP-dependent DNA helicase UvrD/PcrA
MRIGTIHSICDKIIRQYIEYVPLLKKNYIVLDELMQHFFINQNFDEIVKEQMENHELYLGKWNYKWDTIKRIIPYFNKISDEGIDVRKLMSSGNHFLICLAKAYNKYTEVLFQSNRIDHAYQQKIVYELLHNPKLPLKVKKRHKIHNGR